MRKIFFSIVLSFGFGTAFANNVHVYECKHATSTSLPTRKVEVKYLAETGKAPCDVVYTKESGAHVIGHANTETGYCEKSAEKFAKESMKALGFECTAHEAAKEAAPAASTVPATHEAAPAATQETVPAPAK